MRMEIKESPGGTRVLNDSYNANPVSTKAALEFLARETNGHRGRSIAVIGEMLELGDFSEAGHAQVGEAAAAARVGYLFVLGDHADDVRRGALASGQNEKTIFIYPVGAHDRLIDDLRAIVRPGDVILVKGSRGMRMERIAEAMLR
jgi:UDP-N-acetylmuramoyl-tripeptide--D-alanyl-D-alanine ligase